jgi:hypothetical protein
MTRPRQSTLEGVARRGLLVLLSIITDLKGGRPRNLGEVEDPGTIILGIPR